MQANAPVFDLLLSFTFIDMDITDDYVEFIYKIRGGFIDASVGLESMMDLYIAEKLCDSPKKIEEMVCIVLARTTWREKLEIFIAICGIYDSSFLKAHKGIKERINKIIDLRNNFAHLPADITSDGCKIFYEEQKIRFLKFKSFKNIELNSVELFRPEIFDKERIDKTLKEIFESTEAIGKLCKTNE